MDLMLTFPGTSENLRIMGTPEAPEVVAADWAAMLGIKKWHDAVRRYPEDEKGYATNVPLSGKGGVQKAITLREAGMWRMVFQSRKPEAEAVKRWVFGEVLPALRKHGVYPVPQVLESVESVLLAPPGTFTRKLHAVSQEVVTLRLKEQRHEVEIRLLREQLYEFERRFDSALKMLL